MPVSRPMTALTTINGQDGPGLYEPNRLGRAGCKLQANGVVVASRKGFVSRVTKCNKDEENAYIVCVDRASERTGRLESYRPWFWGCLVTSQR
jgi:hypothetical protein